MTLSSPLPDDRGHMPSCEHHGKPPLADDDSSHVDLFCDCHKWAEPMILKNGTDIAWPAGWAEKQAEEWRRRNNLAPPSKPGSGP